MVVADAELSVRERLLQAADELFYAEGVQSVGIDRVIEQAGVAKASLYRIFGSKEILVAEYLRARDEAVRNRIDIEVSRHVDPRDRLLAVFDAEARWIARPTWQGCAFARATAEPSAGELVQQQTDRARDHVRALLTTLAAEAGAADPKLLGTQLFLLYNGGSLVSGVQRRQMTAALRSAAESLVDAAIG